MRYADVDSWIVAKRDLIHWVREPVRVFANLAYPIISVLIFGLVFGSAMNVFGGGDYIAFLLPGMFGQTIAFGVASTIMMVSMDADRGVTDRFRASPMSQTGVVAGRSIADLVNSSLELLVLALCGLVIGWSFNDGLFNALLAFALFLWLRFALVWVGIYLGLLVKPEARCRRRWRRRGSCSATPVSAATRGPRRTRCYSLCCGLRCSWRSSGRCRC